jgi:hypothetical protein
MKNIVVFTGLLSIFAWAVIPGALNSRRECYEKDAVLVCRDLISAEMKHLALTGNYGNFATLEKKYFLDPVVLRKLENDNYFLADVKISDGTFVFKVRPRNSRDGRYIWGIYPNSASVRYFGSIGGGEHPKYKIGDVVKDEP